jgi:hypothetical protein
MSTAVSTAPGATGEQLPPRRRAPAMGYPGAGTNTQLGARPCGAVTYQSAWTTVPLCSVATVALPLASTTAARSFQLSIASCQCLATPAGDS